LPRISVQTCERLIESAAAQCKAVGQVAQQSPANPNFDALSASIAAQSSAIASQATYLTLGSIIFAIVALLAAVGWGWLVKQWAEKAAKDAVREWMEQNAPGQIAEVMNRLTPMSVDGGDLPSSNPLTQDEIEKGFGGEA
jgi:hypothetical protein